MAFKKTNMKYALITGSSSGIGLELAREFASHDHNLILAARSEGKLKELAQELEEKYKIHAIIISTDLARPNAAQNIFDECKRQNLEVDILVNNAGFGSHGAFADAPLQNITEMIQVNITALTELCRLFLPSMIANKKGRIMNVASTAAFQPGPLMSEYYATKAYVLHFSEGLYEELHGTGVTVTALCPGPTQSNFGNTAQASDLPIFNTLKIPRSEAVARYGYQAMMSSTPVAIHGFVNNIMARTVGLMPRPAVRKMVMKLQSRK